MEETSFRIRALRTKLRLTQTQFADVFKSDRADSEYIPQETISKWERGKTGIRNISDKVEALLDFLEDPSSWLLLQGLSHEDLAIRLFPMFDPDHLPDCPSDITFPVELPGRRASLEVLVKETMEPRILCREEWLSLLDRASLGLSTRPLEQVQQVQTIRAIRLGQASQSELQECLRSNVCHGLGPMLTTGCLWMGVTSFKSILGSEGILDRQLFSAVKEGLASDLTSVNLVLPESRLLQSSISDFLAMLEGLGVGLSLNPEKAEEADFIRAFCSDINSMNEGVERLKSLFSEIDAMLSGLVLCEQANGTLRIDKEFRRRMNSTAEEMESLQGLIQRLVED